MIEQRFFSNAWRLQVSSFCLGPMYVLLHEFILCQAVYSSALAFILACVVPLGRDESVESSQVFAEYSHSYIQS